MNYKALKAEFIAPSNTNKPLQILHCPNGTNMDTLLDELTAYGLGGAVMNVNTEENYLENPNQWAIFRTRMQKLRERGMIAWIYDEAGYPSGTAKGKVTRLHPELQAMCIAAVIQDTDTNGFIRIEKPKSALELVAVRAFPIQKGKLQREKQRELLSFCDENGTLTWTAPTSAIYRVFYLFKKWGYEGTHASANVCAFRRYINVLDKHAAEAFLQITHEAYLRELGEDLCGAQAFFMDEPSTMQMYAGALPERFQGKIPVDDPITHQDKHPMTAWSPSFRDDFNRFFGYDIMEYLPDLFSDIDSESRDVRVQYRQCVSWLFETNFMEVIGTWCKNHQVASSGHVLCEENLLAHTEYLGGSLLGLTKKLTFPAIDMLTADPYEMVKGDSFLAARQVSSAAHLIGATRVMSESSDWSQGNQGRTATLEEMRGSAGIQYLNGVNLITSYFNWRTPSFQAYAAYTARLSVLLTAGQQLPEYAVLYPIANLWADYLPQDGNLEKRTQSPKAVEINQQYVNLCRELLKLRCEYDCIDDDSLAEAKTTNGILQMPYRSYPILILPYMTLIAPASLQKVKEYLIAGGCVIIMGEDSEEWKAELHDRGAIFVKTSEELSCCEKIHETVTVVRSDADVLSARHVVDGSNFLYFVHNQSNDDNWMTLQFPDIKKTAILRIFDPLTGRIVNWGTYDSKMEVTLQIPPFSGVVFLFEN